MLAVWDGTPAQPRPVRGRAGELAVLTGLLDAAADGDGAGVVLTGAPGTGKTTLLDAVIGRADGFEILRATGSAAESAVRLAGVEQVLRPLHDLVAALPGDRAEALRPVWGLPTCEADEHGRLSLPAAVSALLDHAARRRPTLICVDSAHLLDGESLSVLTFAARRARHTRVLFVFTLDHTAAPGARPDPSVWAGLTGIRLGGLSDEAAHEVLRDRLGPSLSRDVTDALIDAGCGNPLALVELAGSLSADQLCGRAAPPASPPPGGRLCRTVKRRLSVLSSTARGMVALAVAATGSDGVLTHHIADREGTAALEEAVRSGLVVADAAGVRPSADIVPSAVLATLLPAEIEAAHRRLVEAAEARGEHDRAVWHRAATATAPAPEVVRQLDRIAVRARAEAAYDRAAAAGERAAELSGDVTGRAHRLVAAATDHWASGRPQRARTALRRASPLAVGDLRVRIGRLAGEIELRRGNPSVAAAELVTTARRLAPTHSALAATTLMLAGEASFVAGDNTRYCLTARDAATLCGPRRWPMTLVVTEHFTAMSATFRGQHTAAAAPLRRLVELGEASSDPTAKTLASQAAFTLGDAGRARGLALDAAAHARTLGDESGVPWALVYAALSALLSGRFATATGTALDGLSIARALGQSNSAIDHIAVLAMLAALQGDGDTALTRLEAANSELAERGLGRPGALATWAAACVELSNDRPAEAFDRFRRMSAGPARHCAPLRVMAVPHFVEAAVRCGEREVARRALTTFEQWAATTGGTARAALAHRCHALLADHDGEASARFTEAIRLHRDADAPYDLAVTELLYATWLRRRRNPGKAREVLREAVHLFDELGATQWVRRASRELRACGHRDRGTSQRTSIHRRSLSPQQERIAQLVAEGATNKEIAAQLFISHRTVDHHLRNIFAKLDVRSRVELAARYR
ncbi:helix-turn-helix transcriptional regulator [Saccharomonospora xinjiangensis]|uniref:Response regulator containing a CheY-like receiver domain and an HTH DNA-binding domain n=1 Tax=Saccharomonospora xinjiangensis XJ-54 TaxID=882086 RepID=I0V657_9PSEU|nr:LuxR family transcriptional regulator [Saccharomonospora xinjiangensis]EID55610.1 response regulator containing a CheY-like receiver domain and an HTH DNA-binding domain [Saccharomonospora xinjiangensis XJ-54]